MKHIKPFEILEEDLREFCESCLGYLIDDGMVITIYEKTDSPSHIVWLDKRRIGENNRPTQEIYYWDDIKEYYIPFLKLLDRNYDLSGFNSKEKLVRISGDMYGDSIDIKLDNFINDTFDYNIPIRTIGVLIKK